MKKLITFILSALLLITSFSLFACSSNDEKYTFVMPDGAPALAISKLMNDNDDLSTGRDIEYGVVQAGLIRNHLVTGSADFVLAPVNLASQFYKESSSEDYFVMVAVVTHGNFYIMSTEQISLSDLQNKQIAVPMMGAVPDWTLKMVLNKHGMDYAPQGNVNVKYYAEASDIPPMILSGKEAIGLVPEPAATALQNNAQKQGKTLYRLDLQELYDSNEKAYPQAVLMVKKSVLDSNASIVNEIKQKITESVAWAKENAQSAVTAISNHGATTLQAPALSPSAIDGCKIYFEGASDARVSVKKYIDSIIEIDSTKAKAVGDDFFYTGK